MVAVASSTRSMDQIRMAQATEESSVLVRSVAIELVAGRGTPVATQGIVEDGSGDLRANVLARCGAIADVLDARASHQESQAFKTWLLALAAAVAEAAREGGVLGIAGTRVSEEEQTMLADIAGALRSEG